MEILKTLEIKQKLNFVDSLDLCSQYSIDSYLWELFNSHGDRSLTDTTTEFSIEEIINQNTKKGLLTSLYNDTSYYLMNSNGVLEEKLNKIFSERDIFADPSNILSVLHDLISAHSEELLEIYLNELFNYPFDLEIDEGGNITGLQTEGEGEFIEFIKSNYSTEIEPKSKNEHYLHRTTTQVGEPEPEPGHGDEVQRKQQSQLQQPQQQAVPTSDDEVKRKQQQRLQQLQRQAVPTSDAEVQRKQQQRLQQLQQQQQAAPTRADEVAPGVQLRRSQRRSQRRSRESEPGPEPENEQRDKKPRRN